MFHRELSGKNFRSFQLRGLSSTGPPWREVESSGPLGVDR